MKNLEIVKYLKKMIKKHLFSSIDKDFEYSFKEYLYFFNISRCAVQSATLVAFDFVLMMLYLFIMDKSLMSMNFILFTILKIAISAFFVFKLKSMTTKDYIANNFIHKNIDVIYAIIHITLESFLLYFGPQDIGSYIRFLICPFVVATVGIMEQKRSFLVLLYFQIGAMIYLLHSDYTLLSIPYFSEYSITVVAFASSIFIAATSYSGGVHSFTSLITIEDAHSRITNTNLQLANEVKLRTKLFRVSNKISTDLADTNNENFEKVLQKSMEAFSEALGINRLSIWKDTGESDTFECAHLYQWSNDPLTKSVAIMPKTKPFSKSWCATLLRNYPIQGVIDDFPIQERAYLSKSGTQSTLVLPIRLFEKFWGFARFDDCNNKREFSSVETSIMNTVTLNFAISIYNHQMADELKNTAEEALANAKAKSEFLANMSHEIRTPINAVTGMAKLARLTDDKNEILHCMDCIEGASKQLLGLINDILDMSKIEAGKIELADEPFDLFAVLNNIKNTMSIQIGMKEQNLVVDFPEDLPRVVISDDMRLSQILLNLMSNAIKFTPKKGRIDLIAKKISDNNDGTTTLQFSVQDTGIGMTEDQMANLFQKFEQADKGIARRFGGTGLGLAISKSISEIMNGGISVTSVSGEGSCFTVEVRLLVGTEDMIEANKNEINMEDIDFSKYKALLVDDLDINREIVLAMLEDTGLAIDEAENGQIALDMLEENLDKYDIVLMDIHMPVKDGYTTIEEFRAWDKERAKTLPVIAMTADAFTGDIQRCKDAGMNDHVAKPIDFDELLMKMVGLLEGK